MKNHGRGLGPSPCITLSIVMNNKEKRIDGNDVNGDSAKADAVSSCRHRYVRQVPAVRYQATVRTDKQLRIATWNVNTVFQAGKFII